ncbi:MAG: site-specific integrase [Candidatus Thiodiazotropha lotti]|nr:site-specific integrase [Candidatus Thiodiazotropha lotti]
MATITKTPSNTWKAIIRKRGWPTAIKTFRTKRDAGDWARRTEDEMVRGVYIDRAGADRILLEQALGRYLHEVSSTKRPSTHSAEQHKAKALKANLGAYSLAAITPDLVAKYRDDRLEEGKSASTVRLELSLLSHLFTIAIKEWRIGLFYNPVANIRKPAPAKGRDRRLTADEEKVLFLACDRHSNPMLGWTARIALHTGMRAGEIKSLTRRQVNLRKRTAHLSETKNGSARTVPLTREATEVFRIALSNPVRPLDTDLIFWGEPGRDGKRRPYEFRPAWHRTLKEAGIKGLRFHDLRHEAVSRLVEAGLGDQEVAAISGHKSMQMLKRYTHLRAEDLVERLDQVFNC